MMTAVNGISFDIWPGEIVALVGESGSGKSVTALALAGLVLAPGEVAASELEFMSQDLQSIDDRTRHRLLATDLAVVFQDPMSALNPSLRVGIQLTEKVEIHLGMRRKAALNLAIERLTQTHIAVAARRLRQYPHEFSGGMRQRAIIAMGLMTDPVLILADEPTTALDVTVQAQILDLLRELNVRRGTAILFISHDLAVVREICSRVMVVYAGQVVEELPSDALVSPAHPYTRFLLGAAIDLETDRHQPLAALSGEANEHPTAGCPFVDRCPEAMDRCRIDNPDLTELIDPRRRVACWARVADGTVVTEGRVR
jgi:oligopeptide/dipeptide ABC transporter ATP-binding protein